MPRSARVGCMVTSWNDREAEKLRTRFPDWEIWYVPSATTRQATWCAKPKGDEIATIQVHSADELAWMILEHG